MYPEGFKHKQKNKRTKGFPKEFSRGNPKELSKGFSKGKSKGVFQRNFPKENRRKERETRETRG
jgi:hypothetical protein